MGPGRDQSVSSGGSCHCETHDALCSRRVVFLQHTKRRTTWALILRWGIRANGKTWAHCAILCNTHAPAKRVSSLVQNARNGWRVLVFSALELSGRIVAGGHDRRHPKRTTDDKGTPHTQSAHSSRKLAAQTSQRQNPFELIWCLYKQLPSSSGRASSRDIFAGQLRPASRPLAI